MTIALQAPLSMGFPRQKYWNGLSFPSPEDLPDLEINLWSPSLQADSILTEPPGKLSVSLKTKKSSRLSVMTCGRGVMRDEKETPKRDLRGRVCIDPQA